MIRMGQPEVAQGGDILDLLEISVPQNVYTIYDVLLFE